MRDKLAFLTYLLLVVYTSSLHSLNLLTSVFLFLSFLLITLKRRKLRRTLKVILLLSLFALALTLPYSFWSGSPDYTLVILFRVLDIYLLTLLFLSYVNLHAVFTFSKTLSSLLVLAVSFSLIYRKVLEDFAQAMRSRSPGNPDRKELLNFGERLMGYFFERSIRDAEEVSKAMRSRGFYFD